MGPTVVAAAAASSESTASNLIERLAPLARRCLELDPKLASDGFTEGKLVSDVTGRIDNVLERGGPGAFSHTSVIEGKRSR